MYPNFQDRSYVLTSIISLHFKNPKLGDVIVFKPPTDPEKSYIKRVIGTSDDSVMVQNGSVYLNGKLLDERLYLNPTVKTYGGQFLKEGVATLVPKNKYLVMGDNREASSDSREWGFVDKEKVEGFSFLVYWPINDMKFIKNPYN